MSKTLEMEPPDAGTAIEPVEPAQFEVVQTDFFKDFVKRDEITRDVIFKQDTPFEVWEAYTRGVLELTRRSMRDVGLCLIFGENRYGESYAQAIDSMRYSPKTLQNAVQVVSHVKNWHDNLSFAHHDIVASLTPTQQEKMLTMAEEEGLTVAKLRAKRNELYPPKKTGGKKATSQNFFHKPMSEHELLLLAEELILFLAKAEEEKPFKSWAANRLKAWVPIFKAMRGFDRRAGRQK